MNSVYILYIYMYNAVWSSCAIVWCSCAIHCTTTSPTSSFSVDHSCFKSTTTTTSLLPPSPNFDFMAIAPATKENSEKSDSASDAFSVHSSNSSGRRDVDSMMQSSFKSEEYRLLFRLPPDEILVEDFNCALQDNILLQGHLYLFTHHICFYSNIFGFETRKTIPFHEVTHVRKAKTAAIFPNAIEIVTGEKKHFFCSFLSRDEAYRLIIDGWAQHNSDAINLLSESMSDGVNPTPIVNVDQSDASMQLEDASSSASSRRKDASGLEEHNSLLDGEHDTDERDISLKCDETGKEEKVDTQSFLDTWKIEDVDAPKIPEHYTFVMEATFPVSVSEFFNLFISDQASDFLEGFHQKCGDKEFQCSPWHEKESLGYARKLSFFHPVKVYLGSKLSRCQEDQTYRVYKNSHLMLQTAQHVSDVPYADYFHVERILSVENDGNGENSCILKVYCCVPFSKKTMFKGKIEQSTRDELREVHGIWVNNAHELLKQKAEAKNVASQISQLYQDEKAAESSSKSEGLSDNLHATINRREAPQIVVEDNTASSINKSIHEYHDRLRIFGELWTSLLSYTRSKSQFSLLLFVSVFILILMQISIILLLSRVPEVHVITQSSNTQAGFQRENIEWIEKRVDYLKEDMLMAETRLKRMQQEYIMLKAQLLNLEKVKHKL